MKKKGFTVLEIMVVLGIITVVIAISLPGIIRSRRMAQARACQESLTKISGSKEVWALENQATQGETVEMDYLVEKNYLKSDPICPSGGNYQVMQIGLDPLCDSGVRGHNMDSIHKDYSDWN